MAETSKVPDGMKEKIPKATKWGISDVIPGAPTAITGLPPPRHHTPDQCRAITAVPVRRGRGGGARARRKENRRFRVSKIAGGFQGPVPPNNRGSAARIKAAANKPEIFGHVCPSRCVDSNGKGHLAVDAVYHRSERERTEKGRHVGDERFSSNSGSRNNIWHKGTVVRKGRFALWGGSELIWGGT
jgi:hypothetical protein